MADRRRLRIRNVVEHVTNGESEVDVDDSDGEECEVGARLIGELDNGYAEGATTVEDNDSDSDNEVPLSVLAQREAWRKSHAFEGRPFEFREQEVSEVRPKPS